VQVSGSQGFSSPVSAREQTPHRPSRALAAERAAKVGTTTALLILVGGALAIYGLDQLSKFLVVTNLTEGEVVPVLGTVLQWQFVRNPGAAFSLASGMTWIFTILAAGVITFIVWFARRIRSIAWALVFGLLLGGVLGNLTDRLLREPSFGLGHVSTSSRRHGCCRRSTTSPTSRSCRAWCSS
jgi:signal peptidase II